LGSLCNMPWIGPDVQEGSKNVPGRIDYKEETGCLGVGFERDREQNYPKDGKCSTQKIQRAEGPGGLKSVG